MRIPIFRAPIPEALSGNGGTWHGRCVRERHMKVQPILSIISVLGLTHAAMAADKSPAAGDVVLLHGLGRTHRSMWRVERRLRREGYRVLNLRYPSRRVSADGLADLVDRSIADAFGRSTNPVHFVTHSLGGIAARQYARYRPDRPVGRVVMLGPPNRGSELVDVFGRLRAYRRLCGPMGSRLGTDPGSLPSVLGDAPFELGVIAGDRSVNPLYSWIIPGADDGKVAVARSKLAGMADFVVMHHTHTWMMLRRPVIDQVVHFLKSGSFDRRSAGQVP